MRNFKPSVIYHSVRLKTIFAAIGDYAKTVSVIPRTLGGILNLEILTLRFNCINDVNNKDAPPYLYEILRCINSQPPRLKRLSIQFDIVLQSTFIDDRGRVKLNLNELPPVFTHALWIDIGRVLADLSFKGCTRFSLTIDCTGKHVHAGRYICPVDPSTEGRTLWATIFRWLAKSLVPAATYNSDAEFAVQGFLNWVKISDRKQENLKL